MSRSDIASRRQLFKTLLTAVTTLGGGLALSGLGGCTVSQVRRGITTAQQLSEGDVSKAVSKQVGGQIAAAIPGSGVVGLDSLIQKQINAFIDELFKTWGDKHIATPKEYVKYTDHYQSRALIDFASGHIRVETVAEKDSKTALKNAIVSTLLTPDDPTQVDLFSTAAVPAGKTPFLYGLVVDQDKQAVRYAWRANRFADYLIQHRYRRYESGGKVRHAVDFDMSSDYQGKQQHRYQNEVLRQARRFKIEPALIYGIIQTESAFNPYAVSSAPAYGLMQIVPSTAGRDVHQLLHNRPGQPSKNTLFKPASNIEYGTAYLSILFNRYLAGVKDPKSREYCVIAAYNTGSGNVLKAFHSDRQSAIAKINRLNSQQVYNHLTKHLAYAEARRYLVKVTQNKRQFV